MPMPYVAAKTMEVTRSRVALVYRKVLSPVVALMMGPTMENVPTQNSRQAEMRPLARPSPPRRAMTALARPSRSSAVPATPPTARLRINRTGNSLLGRFWVKVLMPSAMEARPMAKYSTSRYRSPKPFFRRLPVTDPTRIQAVLTIVPIINMDKYTKNSYISRSKIKKR